MKIIRWIGTPCKILNFIIITITIFGWIIIFRVLWLSQTGNYDAEIIPFLEVLL